MQENKHILSQYSLCCYLSVVVRISGAMEVNVSILRLYEWSCMIIIIIRSPAGQGWRRM